MKGETSMCVYVINKNGHPLMPTNRYGKVRRLLNSKQAIVINRVPFTIQLLYDNDERLQPITLGIDTGSKHIGLSATTDSKELYSSDIELRNDIVELISERKELRRKRRNKKTRYRKPRFSNRKHEEFWIPPSVQSKLETHINVVAKIHKILPISKIIIEIASFDVRNIKNNNYSPLKRNKQAKREYILSRDGHTCQCCHGKSGCKILRIHHIESRKTGGNSHNNLTTLCEVCHTKYHQGLLSLPSSIKRAPSLRDISFMETVQWIIYDKLKQQYPDVQLTYGYITKQTRDTYNLTKEHYVDARCITGHPLAEPLGYIYYQRKIRCHNRKIHKCTIEKNGVRKKHQAPHIVRGFQLFDYVHSKGTDWYIHGRRIKGSFVLKNLQNDVLEIAPSKIQFMFHQRGYLIERRKIS